MRENHKFDRLLVVDVIEVHINHIVSSPLNNIVIVFILNFSSNLVINVQAHFHIQRWHRNHGN